MKLGEIANKLGCHLEGDPSIEIRRIAGLEDAAPGDLTFLSNRKYQSKLKTTRASAIIISKNAPPLEISTLRADNPYLCFAKSIELFYVSATVKPGIHPSAIISTSARIGRNPRIGAFVCIDDDVLIGDDVQLYPHVVIYQGVRIGNGFVAHANVCVREFCEIGDNVILQNGVVVGADGFGFAKTDSNTYYKIVQSGKVILEDRVEIQANSTIDRAAVGETRIRRGTKIDNLVQIGHGSAVGENTLLCSQVGLAGSTKVGDNVILAGQVGVAGHCSIGNNVVATAQSGIPSDVEAGKTVSGYPAIDNKIWLRCAGLFSKLPEMNRSLKDIQQKLNKLLNK